MNEAYSMNSKFKFSTCVCTSYGSKLVQDLNGKLLSREQDFQYSNFGAHSKLFHTKKANATMASSMTQATSTGITASKPSSRKERRESLKGLYCVTTDPNDLIQAKVTMMTRKHNTKWIQNMDTRIHTKIHITTFN